MWLRAVARRPCALPCPTLLRLVAAMPCWFLPPSRRTPTDNQGIPMSENFASVSFEDLMSEVAALIVEALNLDVQPQDVKPDDPLYGEGLGLDSIDMLEISLVISKHYGLQLRSDNENNDKIYASLRALTTHIASQRTK